MTFQRYPFPLTIAVDFDATLAGRWVSEPILDGSNCRLLLPAWPEVGEPVEPTLDFVRSAQERGHKIILNTCRTGDELAQAVEACRQWGLTFNAVNENLPERIARFGGTDSRKISADVYIDDSAVCPWFLFPWPADLLEVWHDVVRKNQPQFARSQP